MRSRAGVKSEQKISSIKEQRVTSFSFCCFIVEMFQSDHNFFYLRMLRANKKKKTSGKEDEYELMEVRTYLQKDTGFKSGKNI